MPNPSTFLTNCRGRAKILVVTAPSVIAIDGPVASGKSAVGQELARRLGYRFVDTGLMYRACTLLAVREGVDIEDAAALTHLAESVDMALVPSPAGQRLLANGEDVTDGLRAPIVEDAVSQVSQVPGVRRSMVAQQQRMAVEGSVVMVGRDIGTTVLPAAAKIFLEASIEERVRRRLAEQSGTAVEAQVRAGLELRDRLDSGRADSPLRPANDAVRLNTDELDVDGVVDRALQLLCGAG